MAVADSSNTLTLTGGSSAARLTPQHLIDESNQCVLIAPKQIRVTNRRIIINGFFDDTGWVYVFDAADRYLGCGSSANWKSGLVQNGVHVSGHVAYFLRPNTNSNIQLWDTAALLDWHNVQYFIATAGAGGGARMNMTNTNPLSIIDIAMSILDGPTGGYMETGTAVATFNLRQLGMFIRPLDGVNFSEVVQNGDNNNPSGARLISFDPVIITINGYAPKVSAAGIVRLGNANGGLAPNVESKTILNNPIIPLDQIRVAVYRGEHVIEINTDIEIDVLGLDDPAGVNVDVTAADGSHDFDIGRLTDPAGKYVSRSLRDWAGIHVVGSGARVDQVPIDTIIDRRMKKIVLRRYDLIENVFEASIGADGEYSTSAFMQVDEHAGSSSIPLRIINRFLRFDKVNKIIQVIGDGFAISDLYEMYKSWIALDAQMDQENFLTLDGDTITLAEDWDFTVLLANSFIVGFNARIKNLILTGTGRFSSGTGTVSVGITDSVGTRVLITSDRSDTAFYTEIRTFAAGVQLNRGEQYHPPSSSVLIIVPVGGFYRFTAKSKKHKYFKSDLILASTNPISNVTMIPEPFVSTTVDITPYFGDKDTNPIPHGNNVFIQWSALTPHLAQMVFGAINLKGLRAISKAVFDDRMTSEEGLAWLHNFDNDIRGDRTALAELNGLAYEILGDRININQSHLSFTRIDGLTINQRSFFGETVFQKNETAEYTPPFSNNGDVRISDLAVSVQLDAAATANAIEVVTTDPDYLNAIKAPIAEATQSRMEKSDFLTALSTLVHNSSDTAAVDAELAKLIIADTIANLRHSSDPNESHIYKSIIINTEPLDGNDKAVLSLEVLGAFIGAQNIGSDTEIKIYVDTDIDGIINSATYAANNTAILDVRATIHEYSIPIIPSFNRLIIIHRTAAQNDDYFLRLRDLQIRTSAARVINQKSNDTITDIAAIPPTDLTPVIASIAAIPSTDLTGITALINAIIAKVTDFTPARITALDEIVPIRTNSDITASRLRNLSSQRVAALDNLDQPISGLVAAIEAGLLDDADGQAFLAAIQVQVGQRLLNENITTGAIASAVWSILTRDITTAGSIGRLLKDNIDSPLSAIQVAINQSGWTLHQITQVNRILSSVDDTHRKVGVLEDHIVNDTEYDPVTSILAIKNDAKTANVAEYDIKDDENNPTAAGSKAYKKLRRP